MLARILSLTLILLISCSVVYAEQKWYEGGTLHKSNMVDWRNSTDRNRLATTSDFVVAAHQKNMLQPSFKITSMNGYKILANEVVACANEVARVPEQDVDKILKNQSVKSIVVLCMYTMGWMKN